MKKLAVLFPGIGYNADRPLLYFSKKLLKKHDYEIIDVPYGNLPFDDKNKAFEIAMGTVKDFLSKINFSEYEKIVFVSKSIGTVVSSVYQKDLKEKIYNVYFTPVNETLPLLSNNGIAFSGTSDSWVVTEDLVKKCKEIDLPLYLTEGANHSMEKGDVKEDLETLSEIFSIVESEINE